MRNIQDKYIMKAVKGLSGKINTILIFATISILVVVGFSCEKTIQIDLEDAKIKIVVNGIITPDSIIKVNVTRSRHILDNAEISPLSDAVVKLYENDVLIGDMTYTQQGFYEINHIPSIGKEYKVEVNHEVYDNVYGVTEILPTVPIITLDTITSFDEYGEEMISFTMTFKDPSGERNYYMLNMRNKYLYEEWDDTMVVYDTLYVSPDTTIVDIDYGGYVWKERTEYLWFNTDDLLVEEYMYYSNGVIFSDEIIDGETYSFSGKISKWAFSSPENMIYFELHSLTAGTYKYYKSLNSHYNAVDDPFAEPVIVYTNIEDGIGVLGSTSPYIDSLFILSEFGYHIYDKY